MGGPVINTELLKSRVGIESAPETYPVERGLVDRFVQAVGDASPRWRTEAPPTLIPVLGFTSNENLPAPVITDGTLHSSTELECYRPVYPGDTLTVTTKIADVRERGTPTGKMVFITLERNYRNQRQEAVARCRMMVINYLDKGGPA